MPVHRNGEDGRGVSPFGKNNMRLFENVILSVAKNLRVGWLINE
jgi:hypothetical protein